MAREPFVSKTRLGITWLDAANLSQFPWLLHAFSTRQGGVSRGGGEGLNLGNADARQPLPVRRNRDKFLEAIGARQFSLAAIHQIHSAEIFQVTAGKNGSLNYLPSGYTFAASDRMEIHSGDATMAAAPGVLLSVRTADCLPVLLADSRLRVVAAIHAGWRGALKRIVEKTVGEMRRIFGSEPRHVFAALGPSIRGCCYEVGDEVVDAFCGGFVYGEKFFRKTAESTRKPAGFPGFLSMMPPGHTRPRGSGLGLDLVAVAKDQLQSAGVPRAHIQVADFCTACRTDLFFSYRKEGKQTGRMMAVIGIRPARVS
ncbi:MAG TPA: peptidoglycan editing factor PgeF [Terriglobia bacterium]|nr:peptidoglycan editing factor PgeF [Terriglobia bacterium]